MRFIKSTSLILLLFILTLASCTDECGDINCVNNSNCEDGTCICLSGYEGINCEKEIKAKYLGDWHGSSICNGTNGSMSISLSNAADINQIKITIDGVLINANIYDSDIEIPLQYIEDQDIEIKGKGDVNSTNMTLLFKRTIIGSNENINCIVNLTR